MSAIPDPQAARDLAEIPDADWPAVVAAYLDHAKADAVNDLLDDAFAACGVLMKAELAADVLGSRSLLAGESFGEFAEIFRAKLISHAQASVHEKQRDDRDFAEFIEQIAQNRRFAREMPRDPRAEKLAAIELESVGVSA